MCSSAVADITDKEIKVIGARGIGEIGLAGFAVAVTDAVPHVHGVDAHARPDAARPPRPCSSACGS